MLHIVHMTDLGPLSGGSRRTERVFFAFFKLSQLCWLEINRQVHVDVVGFTYSVLCVCLGVVELGAINHSDGNGTGRYILQARAVSGPLLGTQSSLYNGIATQVFTLNG